MASKIDFLIIGGGSGGLAAARMAASYNKKVVVIEKNKLGGTCVNVGCVPKKVMWQAAHIKEHMGLAEGYGFSINKSSFSWERLVENRNQYIARLNQHYAKNLEQDDIEVITGHAKFIDATTIAVNNKEYTAPHILIATGGDPIIPDVPGAKYGGTSDDFFSLKTQPKKMIVVGSGYIATEITSLMAELGTQVTLLLRKDHVLGNFDPIIGNTIKEEMKIHGVKIIQNSQIQSVQKNSTKLSVKTQNETLNEQYDLLLWAIGRSPNTQNINLQNAGVRANNHGEIEVDEYQNTTQSGIYALGDNTNSPALTPVAISAGRKLAQRLFGNNRNAKQQHSHIPTVIFSHPPAGTVGLSETEAINKYEKKSLRIYQSKFTNMKYALGAFKPPTIMKIITLKDSGKIIGCHLVGADVDEILQGFAVAINMGATKQDFDNTLAIHPTAAEEMVTIK